MIADILLLCGALGAAGYCLLLSRRLRRFTDLEGGVGGAIAVLSAQVDEMTRSLEAARRVAQTSSASLGTVAERAETAAQKLELLIASLHDLPEQPVESDRRAFRSGLDQRRPDAPPGRSGTDLSQTTSDSGSTARRVGAFASIRRPRREEAL